MRLLTKDEIERYWRLTELQVGLDYFDADCLLEKDDPEWDLTQVFRVKEDISVVVGIYSRANPYVVALTDYMYRIIPVNIWLGDIVEEEEGAVKATSEPVVEFHVGDRVFVKSRGRLYDPWGIDDDTLDEFCNSTREITHVDIGTSAVKLKGDAKGYWWAFDMIELIVKTVPKELMATSDGDYINKGPCPYKVYNGPRIGQLRQGFKRK